MKKKKYIYIYIYIYIISSVLFLPHFDVICDLLLNRRTATWNLFVNYIISSVMYAF